MSASKTPLFKKNEIFGVIMIFFLLIVITFYNFRVSARNERDRIRNLDISNIAGAVQQYRTDFGTYPLSSIEGKIVACRGEDTTVKLDQRGQPEVLPGAKRALFTGLTACEWGQDKLQDLHDVNYPPYLDPLPADPRKDNGAYYRYQSDGQDYTIYVAYEGKTTLDYRKSVAEQKIDCGVKFCNAGRVFGVNILE